MKHGSNTDKQKRKGDGITVASLGAPYRMILYGPAPEGWGDTVFHPWLRKFVSEVTRFPCYRVKGSRRFVAQVGVVMAVHAAFAVLLASAPRREGTLSQTRLGPVAEALRAAAEAAAAASPAAGPSFGG